ncbi:MAG: hypothetical protein WBM32_10825 [Crocosphaera sp.]|jgi:hypothetical protein
MNSQLVESIAMMIDSLTSEEKALLKQKVQLFRVNSEIPQQHLQQTATPTEWIETFREWVESHQNLDLPSLSDQAISRESIYGERG